MNLKCVECDKDAEYIFNGKSCCKDHFHKPKPTIQEELQKMNFGESFGVSGMHI